MVVKTLFDMFTIISLNMSTAEVKPKKIRCDLCARIFETPEMLSYHVSMEHNQDRRPTGIS